jgi:uncharacterized protein with von Willebrand factor type A (vWA) domain
MDPMLKIVELFSAARSNSKNILSITPIFSFYEGVWRDNSRRWLGADLTWDVLNTL